MKRNAIENLKKWKESEDRKPLVLKGARQVGKTWLMKEFGKTCYKNCVYFNFDEEDELKSIFGSNKNPKRIIELLSIIAGTKIEPEHTLVIFDEIQECPEALNTLKYFKENAKEYHVIAAGSLLGTLLAQPKSYPVGMVNLLIIYPLTFDEFLEATDESLFAYYRNIKSNQTIEWLVSAGMLNRVYNVSKTEHPLSSFDKLDCFKLFVFDTGLLKYMSGLDNSAILLKKDYQFKGPLAENYVLQQFRGQFELEPRYYADKNSELDFIIQNGTEIIPIEVKAGEDKSAPSFKHFIAENQPAHAIRFSRRNYVQNGVITNMPLYLARKIRELL